MTLHRSIHGQLHAQGGVTCPCNLAPICRPHHRAKTHAKRPDGSPAWSYVTITPGTYLWRSPNDQFFLVDHTGTRHLDHPDRWHPCPDADRTVETAHPPDE